MVKNLPGKAGDIRDSGSIPGRSPGGGHGNPLQYSYLENPMDRGAWQSAVHKVTMNTKSMASQTPSRLRRNPVLLFTSSVTLDSLF